MSLSRCPTGRKQFVTFPAAVLGAELKMSKGAALVAVVSCDVCPFWHHMPPRQVNGTAYRPDPFPPVVLAMLKARAGGRCERDGFDGKLYAHHRRLKASGGSKAGAHTQCACNGLMVCFRCHQWIHHEVGQARRQGLIVLQSVKFPARRGVLLHEHDPEVATDTFWARCDGTWAHSQADVED